MIITMEQTLRRKRNTNVLMSRAIGMQCPLHNKGSKLLVTSITSTLVQPYNGTLKISIIASSFVVCDNQFVLVWAEKGGTFDTYARL
jgi:hypothetical protein